MPRPRIDFDELAAHLVGVDPTYPESIDMALDERWEITMEAFEEIAEALLRLTPTVKGPITGDLMHAYLVKRGDHFYALVKVKAEGRAPLGILR